MFSRMQGGFRLMAVFLTFLLAVTMLPAAGMQAAFADEPSATMTDAASEGFLYKVTDGKATLVGFEDGASLEGDLVVPESVEGATVVAVEIAEGQVAEGVTSLTLPQTVESVRTEGLASAFPSLASIEVDGTAGAYSTSGGMLFLQGRDAASSDGSTTLAKNRELVWAPPALVVARLPIECKSIAPGAFVDAAALETVMCPGVMESIAVAEKDEEGNTVKPGAFTDEQIASLSIVVPGTNIASPSGDRVSASVALSEDEGMEAKREAWWKHGFDSDKIVMGTSFGEVEGVVAVSDDGTVEEPSIDVLKPYEKRELAEAAESGDESAAARLAAPEGSGLSFSYNADMNLSVSWAGDKTATPAAIEIPAYVTIDGVKYAVTEVAPEAFKGAVFLTSVTIPGGVRIIGESAFEGCANLKEVSLPSTLRTIDYAAFRGCSALESVDVPDTVTWIGGKAFEGTSDLVGLSSTSPNDLGLLSDGASAEGLTSFASARPRTPSNLPGGLPSTPARGNHTSKAITDIAISVDGKHVQYVTAYKGTMIWLDDPFTLYNAAEHNPAFDGWQEGSQDPRMTFTQESLFWGPVEQVGVTYCAVDGVLWLASHSPRSNNNDAGCFSYLTALWLPNADGTINTSTVWRAFAPDGNVVSEAWLSWMNFKDMPTFYAVTPPPIKIDVDDISYGDATITDDSKSGLYISGAEWNVSEKQLIIREGAVDASQNRLLTTVTASGDTITFSDPSGGGSTFAKITPKYGWTCGGDWYIRDKNNPADTGTLINGQMIDGSKEWVVFRSHTPRTFTIDFHPNHADGWVSNNPMGETVTYTMGTDKPLAEPTRDGFWFAGWVWTNSASGLDADPGSSGNDGWSNGAFTAEGATDAAARQFTIPAGAYGNARLKAVWKPKMYRVRYDVDATAKKDGSGNMAAALGDSYFVHPAARAVIAEGSGNGWTLKDATATNDDGSLKYPEMDLVDLSQVNRGGSDNLNYVLTESDMYDNGFLYEGWTNGRVNVGVIPASDAGKGPWLQFPDTAAADDASKAAALTTAKAMVGNDWDADNKEPAGGYNANNDTTLYGVWKRGGEVPITLANTLPREVASGKVDDGEALRMGAAEVAKDTPGQEITYWRNRGLFLYGELIPTETYQPDHTTTTPFDKALSTAETQLSIDKLQFDELKRHGFRFLGWGKRGSASDGSQDAVYLKYVENGAAAGNPAEFYLTQEGMDYALQWNTGGKNPAADEGTADTWDALWEIRTYKVTLRLPAAAVESDSVELRNDKADPDDPATYGWRKEAGDNSGWYVAERTWDYYDVIDVPKKSNGGTRYVKKSNFYTYEGWYLTNSWATDNKDPNGEHSLMTEAQGLGSGFRVMANNYDEAGNWTSTNLLFQGTVPSGATAITKVTDTENVTAPDGECVLWLNFSPVIINVTAPVGVFLAGDEDGGAYVVGSDPRMHLETEAKFTVKKTTHDLVLTGVTATDIVDAKVGEIEGDATSGPNTVSDIVTSGGTGLCDRMLLVNNPGTDAGDREEDNGSRVFWISPVETVNDYAAGSKDTPGTKNEFTRRYFGFGEGGLSDNTLWDDPDTTTTYDADGNAKTNALAGKSENDLSAFKLRMPETVARPGADATIDPTKLYKNDKELKGGLRPVQNGEYVDYRFYYGLDLSKCKFDLGEIQRMVEADTSSDPAMKPYDGDYNDGWKYNEDHKTPMLRLMFTFAVERQQLVSYSARFGEVVPAQNTDVLETEGLVTVGK